MKKQEEKEALKRAMEVVGGGKALGRAVGVSGVAVQKWLRKRIPAERCAAVEKITGVSKKELRPDLWGE